MGAEVSAQWAPIAKLATRKAVWLVFHKRLLSWQDLRPGTRAGPVKCFSGSQKASIVYIHKGLTKSVTKLQYNYLTVLTFCLLVPWGCRSL